MGFSEIIIKTVACRLLHWLILSSVALLSLFVVSLSYAQGSDTTPPAVSGLALRYAPGGTAYIPIRVGPNTSRVYARIVFDGPLSANSAAEHAFEASDIGLVGSMNESLADRVTNFSVVDPKTYDFQIEPPAGGAFTKTITLLIPANSFKDAAGNSNDEIKRRVADFENQRPTVTATSSSSNHDGNTAFTVTFTFNEDMDFTSFATSDVTVNGTDGSGVSNPTQIGARVFQATITPSNIRPSLSRGDDIDISMKADKVTDLASNGNVVSNTVKVVSIAPKVVDIIARLDPNILTSITTEHGGSPVFVDFFFSQDMDFTTFAASDVTVNGTDGLGVSNLSQRNPKFFRATITPPTSNIDISMKANKVSSSAGHGNIASGVKRITYVPPPTVTFTNDVEAGPVQSDTVILTTGGRLLSRFSKYAFVDSKADCTTNGASFFAGGAGTSYTSGAHITFNTEANNGKYICAQVGNDIGPPVYTVSAEALNIDDTTSPNVTDIDAFQAGTTTAIMTHDGSTAFEVTIIFDEVVTGFDAAADVEVKNSAGNNVGTVTVPMRVGSPPGGRLAGQVYTVQITPNRGTTESLIVSVPTGAAQDTAGNGNLASPSGVNQTLTYQDPAVVAPTVRDITFSDSSGATLAEIDARSTPIDVLILFSKDVQNFDAAGDVTVSGGGLSGIVNLTPTSHGGSQKQYKATINAPSGGFTGAITVTVPVGDTKDSMNRALVGTPAARSKTLPFVSDPAAGAPRVSNITFTPTNINADTPHVTATVTFSENVYGFDATNDVTVNEGTPEAPKAVSPSPLAEHEYTVKINAPSGGFTTSLTIEVRTDNGVRDTVARALTGTQTERSKTVPFGTVTVQDIIFSDGSGNALPNLNPGVRSFVATITFNKSVRNFDAAGDVTVSGGGLTGTVDLTPASLSGSQNQYTVTVNAPTGGFTGDVTVIVPAGDTEDLAGTRQTASGQETINFVGPTSGAPTVTIATVSGKTNYSDPSPIDIEFTFNETIQTTGPGAFTKDDIDLTNATLTRDPAPGSDPKVYTAQITPTAGAVTGKLSIVVTVAANKYTSSASNTANLAQAVTTIAFDDSDAERQKQIQQTQRQIRQGLQQRAMLAIQMQPNLSGFLDGTILQGGTTLGNLSLNGLDQDTGEVDYFVSLGQLLAGGVEISGSTLSGLRDPAAQVAALEARLTARHEAGEDSTLDWGERQGLDDLKRNFSKERLIAGVFRAVSGVAGQLRQQLAAHATEQYDPTRLGYDGWVQLRYIKSKFGDSRSHIRALYLGGHRYLGEDFIVGLMGRLDWSDEKNRAAGSSSDGDGWMVGPYAVRKLGEHSAWLEVAAMWGKGDNQIRPTGTYEDQYDSERWYASAKLSGLIEQAGWRIVPSASLGYYREKQDDYTDKLGNPIGSQSAYSGEVDFGPSVMRTFYPGNGGLALTPRLGFSGVYNFKSRDTQNSEGQQIGIGGWRGKLDGGLSIQMQERVNVDLSAFYDGLGQSDYRSVGANIRLRYSW